MSLERTTVVTAAATSHDLTVLATVKTVLGITTTTDDAYLALMITQASAAAEAFCNRVFARETVQDTFRITGAAPTKLLLSRLPAPSIVSVVESGVTLSASAYQLDAPSGLLSRLNDDDQVCFWASPAKIVVTYAGGYVLPGNAGRTLPEDIEGALITMVANGWHSRGRDPSVSSETTPNVYEVVYRGAASGESGDLPPDALTKLSRHIVHAL